ncbi:MAG: hypothetical protein ABIB47_06555 [Candidatus Woesearchaeota archaeon]
MSGPGVGKRKIKDVVYIHEKGKSRATITHLDIEGSIQKIIGMCGSFKNNVMKMETIVKQ